MLNWREQKWEVTKKKASAQLALGFKKRTIATELPAASPQNRFI
jgi:hypothetical protein